MGFTLNTILFATGLFSVTLATSSFHTHSRQTCTDPSVDQVKLAINDVQDDINTLNGFFNKHAADTVSSASIVSDATADEAAVTDMMTTTAVFASICELNNAGVFDYEEAISNLDAVLPTLQAILGPNELGDPQDARFVVDLANANDLWCCTILGALAIVIQDAADDFALANTVTTNVLQPNTCDCP